jgi:predicted nuclease with TOPRIM domain
MIGQSQSVPQTKKEKLLTQLNFTIQEENHELLEKNESMARELEAFKEEQHKLKANNIRLTQEFDSIAENNRLLQQEKQRLAQLFQ